MLGWACASGHIGLGVGSRLCGRRRGAAAEPSQVKFGVTVVIPSGLKGQIYKIKKDSDRLPNFRKLKPIGAIYTSFLNVPNQDFREGFPGVSKRYEWFAIDYTGKFWIEKPGRYRFLLTSDDGSKLYVDDKVVVDNDGVHPSLDRAGGRRLSAVCIGYAFRTFRVRVTMWR